MTFTTTGPFVFAFKSSVVFFLTVALTILRTSVGPVRVMS